MLVDTHAHLNFSAFREDSEKAARRALQSGVWFINVGSQIDTSRRAVKFAKDYNEGVFAAVGLHPIHLKQQSVREEVDEDEFIEIKTREEKFDPEKYIELARDPKVVAIGEIGLDYYHNAQNKNLQREALLEQLNLAESVNKPVILHCREAHNDLLEILKNWTRFGNKEIRGVVHSFSGRWSQAREYLAMGFYLGFNGIITFARDYDRIVKEAPLDRLVVETDCPYLTPIPFRGKRNEPAYVKYVAEKVAEIRNISVDEVAKATTDNARKLFGI
ncbi:MAG: Hydrolase, TatD family [Parcubacteria group bacterium GW2011_GWC1_43_12]|nr:MAG: Hydrolase, TatD family [Parcubacteria group bacterium GW2011_GWB1_42_6]KKS91701.1 MAG: Hydrolase, TatD family [Parcubacteria group bacterium GW2011_GWC1_43_12]